MVYKSIQSFEVEDHWLEPSFLDLVNTPDTNVLSSVTFALATMFFPLSNATSVFII